MRNLISYRTRHHSNESTAQQSSAEQCRGLTARGGGSGEMGDGNKEANIL